MKIILDVNDAPEYGVFDVSEDDMETEPFHYALEELSQHINGKVLLSFSGSNEISLDLFYDFSLCYDEIVESIKLAQEGLVSKDDIWFCDQGSDFHILYEITTSHITINYNKGEHVGLPNKNVDDFSFVVDRDVYVEQWETVFLELSKMFRTKLNKEIPLPF